MFIYVCISLDFVTDNSYHSQDRSIAVWDMTSH
jgi:hypothetical protein